MYDGWLQSWIQVTLYASRRWGEDGRRTSIATTYSSVRSAMGLAVDLTPFVGTMVAEHCVANAEAEG